MDAFLALSGVGVMFIGIGILFHGFPNINITRHYHTKEKKK